MITAETENRLVVIDLRTARTLERIALPSGPQYVAAEPRVAVVSSPNAGAVTVLDGHPWRIRRVLRGFGSPHLVVIAPDGGHAYVTDDARGTVAVIDLGTARIVRTIHVGSGAHHLAASPDGRRLWIALGESARTIVVVDTTNVSRPRVIGRFDPGFPAHDLSFVPDGRSVWVTSAAGPDVGVFTASGHRLVSRVPVGPPPQHIAFSRRFAYLTSGYGRIIERVAVASRRVTERSAVPYGSFELDSAGGYVATASLLDGRVAIFTPALRSLRVLDTAPVTRDIEIVRQ
jgi:YVTN family beta-propeller protein